VLISGETITDPGSFAAPADATEAALSELQTIHVWWSIRFLVTSIVVQPAFISELESAFFALILIPLAESLQRYVVGLTPEVGMQRGFKSAAIALFVLTEIASL
jgi:hypothetical protein